MVLSPGIRLGPYAVLAPLGAGGMGEVYRAKDTRLDRSVALKVLPAEVAHDPERRARFERAARTVSSLNHPHICTLYDVGNQDGIDHIVLELIEGETLLDRLKKGPLPLPQALRYGIEIADALDKAHRSGVVHRDLKPGNVILANAGTKLMDFGLAKQGSLGEGARGDLSVLPTQAKPLTEAGSLCWERISTWLRSSSRRLLTPFLQHASQTGLDWDPQGRAFPTRQFAGLG